MMMEILTYETVLWGLDLVGFYSFNILSFVAVLTLYRRWAVLLVYVVGGVANLYLNWGLKALIRDPRPPNPLPMVLFPVDPTQPVTTDTYYYVGVERYGFPSGHAQLVFYALAFLYFVQHRITRVWTLCFLVGVLTLYQRLKYRRHTVEQLLAGVLVGSVTGWLTVELTQTSTFIRVVKLLGHE
jgi:membrane-associated phospholipid phosphatase